MSLDTCALLEERKTHRHRGGLPAQLLSVGYRYRYRYRYRSYRQTREELYDVVRYPRYGIIYLDGERGPSVSTVPTW
jgi:hypothetical protein